MAVEVRIDPRYTVSTAVKDSAIQVPVDLQSILPKKAELYDADETVEQSISLDIGGFKTVEVYCSATTATTFTVELSWDNTHWITYYSSASAETSYHDVFTTTAQYVRVKSASAGASGDTVTLIIGAKP